MVACFLFHHETFPQKLPMTDFPTSVIWAPNGPISYFYLFFTKKNFCVKNFQLYLYVAVFIFNGTLEMSQASCSENNKKCPFWTY